MSECIDDLIPVNSWDEVPAFKNEDEEADFWGTHSLGEPLLEQMRPIDTLCCARYGRRLGH